MFWKKARPHADEFRTTWFGAKSIRGFRVELRSHIWIDHIAGNTKRSVFFEGMAGEHGLIVHASDTRGFEGVSAQERDVVLADIRRALEFLRWKLDWVD